MHTISLKQSTILSVILSLRILKAQQSTKTEQNSAIPKIIANPTSLVQEGNYVKYFSKSS